MAWLAPLDRIDRAAIGAEIERLRDEPVSRLLRVAQRMPEWQDRVVLQDRLEEAILQEVPGIDRSLWLLDTIVTLAPLLGLLGTIVGMFKRLPGSGKARFSAD